MTPTPREMRALETASATELAAGCREVEREQANRRTKAWSEYLKTDTLQTYDGACGCWWCRAFRAEFEPWYAARQEADLARAWTAADPPAEPGEEARP